MGNLKNTKRKRKLTTYHKLPSLKEDDDIYNPNINLSYGDRIEKMSNIKNLSLEYLKYHQDNADKFLCIAPLCNRKTVPHHLKKVGSGRNRKKSMLEHFTIVDMCIEHHSEAHDMTNEAFEVKYSVNLWKTALINLARYLFERFG